MKFTLFFVAISAAIPVFVTSASNPPKDGWQVSILIASVIGAGIHTVVQRTTDAPPPPPAAPPPQLSILNPHS